VKTETRKTKGHNTMRSHVYIRCAKIIFSTSSICFANADFMGDFANFRQQHRKIEGGNLNMETSMVGITKIHIDEESKTTDMVTLRGR